MSDIQIGKYLLSKKGFGILFMFFFLVGVIIGGIGVSSYLDGNKIALSLPLIFRLVVIWKVFKPQLIKEISIIN